MKRTSSWLCAAWLSAFAASAAMGGTRELQERIDTDDFALPVPQALGERLKLWATWYHVTLVDAASHGFRLFSVVGEAISPPIPAREWCIGALQGEIMVKAADGLKRTYTFETTVADQEIDCADYFRRTAPWMRAAGRSRFGMSTGPYGDGAAGYQVVPFRTIAVDPRFIPLGSVVYIPAARGIAITLPSGRRVVHDGYFFASDTGGAIRDNHIDVFTGHWARNPFPSFVLSTPRRTFAAYVVEAEFVKSRLRRLHAIDAETH